MNLISPAHVPVTATGIMGEAYAADPWPALHALRAQGPVVWHETYRRWLVTTHEHVHATLNDYERFTVEGTSMVALFGKEAFISMDERGPHDELRNVWAAAFRKTVLEGLRAPAGRIVERLVASVAARLHAGEAVEIIPALCRPLPTLVIAHMMGVPEEMLAQVIGWTDAMSAGGPAYQTGAAAAVAQQAREAAKTALADYLTSLLRARRVQPGDDLISTLAVSAAARSRGDDALVPNIRQLLFAGNETTAKWLANIFVSYAEHPDVWRELGTNRALVRPANEEVLRWQGVTGSLVRKVRGQGAQIADVALEDGAEVTLLLAAANRDPARYENPDAFDIHRPAKANLGFGFGLHHCLGLNLARLEAEMAVQAALDQFPPFSIAAPYGYSTLPVRGPLPVVIRAMH